MKVYQFGIVVALIFAASTHDGWGAEPQDIVKQEVKAFESLVLKAIAGLGSDVEERLLGQMRLQREKVIAIGEPAIPHLCKLLKHEQVNVRRGSAIALSFIVEQQKVQDEKLLDFVLLRMVEDEDIKARNNLYHVANAVIDNLKLKKKKPDNPASS